MKTFEIITAKRAVASFKIDGTLFKLLGNTWTNPAVDKFFAEHPEYKGLPLDHHWVITNTEDYVEYTIYSLGESVVVEIH